MSTKNGLTSPPYISHVRLKGYKSIIDTSVKLHPGLNIIIGPNGSGKTNFLELLNNLISLNFGESDFEATLTLVTKNKEMYLWEIEAITRLNEAGPFLEKKGKITNLDEIKPKKSDPKLSNKSFPELLDITYKELFEGFSPISFIQFSLPEKIHRLNKPITVTINKRNGKTEFPDLYLPTTFISKFLYQNFFDKEVRNLISKKKDSLLKKLKINEELKRNFKKFSPIEDIRVGEGLSIKENGVAYYLNYIEFEFLVNGHWLSWNMLSDGTRKLFYLISEITFNKGICFIEEPEIGVHPDQYRKILTFLKEESEDKQIIITTHAPRTLDILKDEELNKIILTRFDKELGTKMRHLTKEEIKHAINYRENDGSTSELWTYTGFFDEEEAI